MSFINAHEKLTELNIKANSVYTKIVDSNVKPMAMSIYKKFLSEHGYGKSIWLVDMDYLIKVVPFEAHDVLVIEDYSTCADRNVISLVIADKNHIQAAHCFEAFKERHAYDIQYILHGSYDYNDGVCFYKKEETLCEPYYNGHSLYDMSSWCGFIEENIIFCIDTVENCYRNLIIENNFNVSDL